MLQRLFLFLVAIAATPAGARTAWPHGAKAVVVLTYDDALASQLDHVVPVLGRARLHGTFFLSSVRRADVARWRAVAAAGNELANHSLFHPCLAADFKADPRYTLEAYTPATMLREIEQQNVLLTALDGRAAHGFGTPCGETLAGGVDYIAPLRAAHLVTYARGAFDDLGEYDAAVGALDPMNLPAHGFDENVAGAELIAFVRRAEAGNGWAVLLFHGVGGDYLSTSDAAHRELVAWLAAHRREVWVTTLQAALDWARAHPDRTALPPSSARR